ncbi:MAG: transcription elongation factor GreA [Actinobacteria bacterium]|nr:MAG: transcription elongation factor GreA [Actinomycetota bacterium]
MSQKEVVLTPEGYKKLEEELNHLTTTKRKEVADRIKQSIEFGDLSENSEYDDAKNEQAFVEGRISQLRDMLSNVKVIDDRRATTSKVSLGSLVTLKDLETKEKMDYLVVGFAEADPTNHKISNESPVGQAIMDKKAGETVTVETPQGQLQYRILKISRNHKK